MIRASLPLAFLLLIGSAIGAQAPVPKESVTEETLRIMLRKPKPEPDYFQGSRIEEARKAVIRYGPTAIPGLFAVLKNEKASRAEHYCAVKALIELDPQGKQARDLLILLEQGRVPFTVGNTSDGSPGAYLGRFLQDEADLKRLVELLAKEDRDTALMAMTAFSHFRPDHQKRFAPDVLRKTRNVEALQIAPGAIKVDSEEVRAALLALAQDDTKPGHIRLRAVEAFADRGSKNDYQRVADVLQKIPLEEPFPSQSLAVLARLDWKKAQAEHTRHFAAIRARGVKEARDKDNPPPCPFNSYSDVFLLGTEEQVQVILRGHLEYVRKGGPVYGGSPGYYLWQLGYREAAPLFLERRLRFYEDEAALHYRLGLDVQQFVENTLKKESPWRSFRLAANENIPVALILKHKQAFIERCEKVLTSNAGAEDLNSRGSDSHFVEERECRRQALVILGRLAPERAKLLAATIKLDPLPEVPPEIGWREVLAKYEKEKDWAARLASARRLLSRSHLLPEETAREVEKEIAGHLRNLAGYERLSLATLLAVHGNQEGEAVLDSYLQGNWQPWSSHLIFSDLARWAKERPEPFAGRARRKLVAAVAHHVDPNVQAAAVREAERCLNVREEKGGQYPFVRALLDQLGPEKDWRVRAAAGLVLRRALKDLWPEWDYYHLGDKEKLQQAANDVRKWWAANEGKILWVPAGDSVTGFGYFQVGK